MRFDQMSPADRKVIAQVGAGATWSAGKINIPDRQCVMCDSTFSPRSGPATVCSGNCRRALHRRASEKYKARVRAQAVPITERLCAHCGSPFVPRRDHPRYLYCSRRCTSVASAVRAGRPMPLSADGEIIACLWCRDSITAKSRTHKYCSARCGMKHKTSLLSASIIRSRMARDIGVSSKDIPPELLDLQISKLRLHRLIKERTSK